MVPHAQVTGRGGELMGGVCTCLQTIFCFSEKFLLGKQNKTKIKNDTDGGGGGGGEIAASLCVAIDHSSRSYCVPEY